MFGSKASTSVAVIFGDGGTYSSGNLPFSSRGGEKSRMAVPLTSITFFFFILSSGLSIFKTLSSSCTSPIGRLSSAAAKEVVAARAASAQRQSP